MRLRVLLSAPFVLATLAGCGPDVLEFASPPPTRILERGPLLSLPAVVAKKSDGTVVEGAKIDLEVLPTGVLLVRPEGISVVNRGEVTLTYTSGKAVLKHTLSVQLPTRVELRCLPSCSGAVGNETKLDTTVYSEEQVLADVQAACTTNKPDIAKVDGATLKFIAAGSATMTCKSGEAEITKPVEVVPPPPPPPPEGAPADGAPPAPPADGTPPPSP